MNFRPPLFAPVWAALPLASSTASDPAASPANLSPEWQELGQAWRTEPEADLNPGWARIRWNVAGLLFESMFQQRHPANRARTLNERTWELGDIAEFFLQETTSGNYLELHVTPENQRLQLAWPLGGLDRFRAGEAALEDFLVTDPQWVESTALVSTDYWSTRALVPFACLGLNPEQNLPTLRTAVCRYDRSLGPELLSSTARLAAPNYHRHAEWAELKFVR